MTYLRSSANPLHTRRAVALFPGETGKSLLRPFPFTTHRNPSASYLSGEQPSRADDHVQSSSSADDPALISGSGDEVVDRVNSTGTAFDHISVMRDEVVEVFANAADGIVVDATLGAGGHAEALLDAYPSIRVVGVDRDVRAVAAATARLTRFGDRFVAHHARFDALSELVEPNSVDGVLFDLGVSSPQLDRSERGFSHRGSGPLDMRMDERSALTAADVINEYSTRELINLLKHNADEPNARRIAEAIVAARPLASTKDLTEAVLGSLPAAVRRRRRHPAMRTFQAIRIEVNGELEVLEPGLMAAVDSLKPAGRVAVLAYHSGEDRIVKRFLREESRTNSPGRPDLPRPTGSVVRLRLLWSGARKPSSLEVEGNSRASSARMRAAERTENGL